ncbi:hypothetical protein EDB92DRAFT_1887507 [Lactarius akahatsu]|uniref:Uncharacterized protein n=1 Tax=Lactarius akahatsu TaxID=416441 RepID=A0AAD4QA05_9AGAM|nr:hypothetical protein EDB92DRAFT_1887507 [Lactarius akahatsu]
MMFPRGRLSLAPEREPGEAPQDLRAAPVSRAALARERGWVRLFLFPRRPACEPGGSAASGFACGTLFACPSSANRGGRGRACSSRSRGPRVALSPLHANVGVQRVEGAPQSGLRAAPLDSPPFARRVRDGGEGGSASERMRSVRVAVLRARGRGSHSHSHAGPHWRAPFARERGLGQRTPPARVARRPDLRSAPSPSARPRFRKGGNRSGDTPNPFVRAQHVPRDPSFRAPPRGERGPRGSGGVGASRGQGTTGGGHARS